ncbi:MAG: ABC-F family ATP-binding cassette domain-containing protein [Myxococcota bacterium]|nr:ABC-F family ATP-binding cassette domain-containing protein [Myxococcota bacterium]
MLLRLDDVARRIGARTLFQGVSLHVAPGDRIGLVGPNGAGKTTLMRLAAGLDEPDAGRRITQRGARIGLLGQEIDPSRTATVREDVGTALAHLDALESEIRETEQQMAEAGEVSAAVAERYDQLQQRFAREGGFEREARIERVLSGLGFREEVRDRPLRSFSGGWLVRVELAKLLLAEPDVLLLDEPTNHLDIPSIQWFEETLAGFPGGVVSISHDRAFLRRNTTAIAELAGGRFTVYAGSYDFYLKEREQRREALLAQKRSQDRKVAETERFIERFRAKATKARQVQSRVKALEKLERVEVEEEDTRRIRLRIPDPARAGAIPMRLSGIHKRYGDTVVYEGIDFELKRGERLALVGPNGAGKSTLLRILAGVLDFDAGERSIGHQVQVAFYAQHQLEALQAGRTVLSELEHGAKAEDFGRLRSHLGAFLFSGDDVDKKVSVLSGGEKARLALAKMLLRPANLLVLDEPTNHLDIQACEVLEGALRGYTGTVVFISHDRDFIDALATRVVEVDDGGLENHLGNYSDYLHRKERQEPKLEREPAPEARGKTSTEPASAEPTPAEPTAAEPTAAERKAARQLERERQKARDRITRRIAKVEAEILEREQSVEEAGLRLGDPEVYKDGDQVREIEAQREALRSEVQDRYGEWERLAAELEALDDAR